MSTVAEKPVEELAEATVRFCGDSGDGMQLAGTQFTTTSALVGNDVATFPDFPAEIRAPRGTKAGVSGFQVHFSSQEIYTPGDTVDALVAMNPAAFATNLSDLRDGGILVVNESAFDKKGLDLAGYEGNPIEDVALHQLEQKYKVYKVDMTKMTRDAVKEFGLGVKEADRCRNFFAMGLVFWIYGRPLDPTLRFIETKFGKRPDVANANTAALKAGYNYGETVEAFDTQFHVPKAELSPGTYRSIMGNTALSWGLMTAAKLSDKRLFLGAYPITPASDILHELCKHKNHDIVTFQAEDEIAAICAAIGASFTGDLGMTGTSGPGVALKTEAMGLAVSVELPLVIVDIQRAGPSTGMPTKVEQTDLLQAIFGRNGEAPIPVVACATPADCFEMAIEACRIAVQYMTPVMLLSDNYVANGSEPWRLPDLDSLEPFPVQFLHSDSKNGWMPFKRDEKGARAWVRPGTPGLEHRIGGLEKEDGSGNISYDAENHEKMTHLRQQKVMNIRDSIPTPAVDGPEKGDLLVLGWGSTKGCIASATTRARSEGHSVAATHLRHVWPLPHGLAEMFSNYRAVLIPEMNMGQLARVLRSEYPRTEFISYSKVQGKPFTTQEIYERVVQTLEN